MFKIRIGITQKIKKNIKYNETLDCLDTNWAKLLVSLEILPIPLPLIPVSSLNDIWKELKLDGVILSGGNTIAEYADNLDKIENISKERDKFEMAILAKAISTKTPVLGVCRGLQVINLFYKGKLKKIRGHAGTKHRLIIENSKNNYQIPSEVNSFHNFGIPRKYLGEDLISLAYDLEDNIEAFYHPKDSILGIMWHPERELPIIESDVNLIKKHFKI